LSTIISETQREKILKTLEPFSPTKINYFANTALILSISGFIFGFTFILGIILGHVSLYRINRLEKETKGAKQAAWALIIGYFGVASALIFFSAIIIGIIEYYIQANI
jgi:hypothetical protein